MLSNDCLGENKRKKKKRREEKSEVGRKEGFPWREEIPRFIREGRCSVRNRNFLEGYANLDHTMGYDSIGLKLG